MERHQYSFTVMNVYTGDYTRKSFGVAVSLKKNAGKMHSGKLIHMLIRNLMTLIETHVSSADADIFLLVHLMSFKLLVVHFGNERMGYKLFFHS